MSSRGRIIKTTGMNEKKLQAIQKLQDMKNSNVKRLDQYEVSTRIQTQN